MLHPLSFYISFLPLSLACGPLIESLSVGASEVTGTRRAQRKRQHSQKLEGTSPTGPQVSCASYGCVTVTDSGDPDSKSSFTRAKRWWFDFHYNREMKCHGQWVRYVCNIGVGDLPWVINSPHMFVNKIRLEQDPTAFGCLELWYRDRVRQQWRLLANGNETFDVSHYASQPFVHHHVG